MAAARMTDRDRALGEKLRDAVTEGYLDTCKALDVPALAARLRWSESKVRRVLDLHRGAPDGVHCQQDGRAWVYAPALWHMRDRVLALRADLEEANERLVLDYLRPDEERPQ